MRDIPVNYEEIVAKTDASPIWYVNLEGEIRTPKSKKVTQAYVKNVVVKGTLEQIKAHPATKTRFLKQHFKAASNANKKVKDFNLDLLTITKVDFMKSLGYGKKLD